MSRTIPHFTPSLFNQYLIAFEGSSLACILYGLYFAIAGVNISLLREKRYRVILSITITQLVITTIYMAISLFAAPVQLLGFFNVVDTFGDPDALSTWPAILVDCMFVINTWISDAFLLYRCYVIWMGNKYVFALASVFYLAVLSSSLAWLVVDAMPGAVYSTHSVQVIGTAYFSCSTAMNIFLSSLISVRLWMHRRTILKAVGPEQGRFFLGYMAMTLEGALLYAVFAVTALGVFLVNSPLQNVFFPVLGLVQVIAPALIINRMARGISFEKHERVNVTVASMRFAPRDETKSALQTSFPEALNHSDTILCDGKMDYDDFGQLVLDEIKVDV